MIRTGWIKRLVYGDSGGWAPSPLVRDVAQAPPHVDEKTTTEVEDAALRRFAQLAPFSPVTLSLLRLFDKDDIDAEAVARLVGADSALAAEVLAFANSPLYAMTEKVSNLRQAISVVGTNTVRVLTTTLTMRALLQNAPKSGVVRRIWRHSVATATIASHLAPAYGLLPDLGDTIGILHDLGRAGLLFANREEYSGLLLSLHDSPADILARESTACGVDHCAAGLYLAQKWGFPTIFHDPISRHHEDTSAANLLGLTHAACSMADELGYAAAAHGERLGVQLRIEHTVPKEMRLRTAERVATIDAKIVARLGALDF